METTTTYRNRSVLAAVMLSALLVSGLVFQASRSAFSATTNNTGNSFTAGTLTLTDDDTATAMFNVTGLVPGTTTVRCITVTYAGTITDPAAVKLYSGGYTDSGTFSSHLNLTVEEGTGGAFGNCTGFTSTATIVSAATVSSFGTVRTNYGNGAGTWDPAASPASRTYRFTVQLDPATPNSQQGQSVTALGFVWEVQS